MTKLGRASRWFLVKMVFAERGGAAEESRVVGREERHKIEGFVSAIDFEESSR